MKSPSVRLFVLSIALLLPGCVLPGALQSVGRYEIHGQLLDADGQGLQGKNILLLQPHASRVDKKAVDDLAHESVQDREDSRIVTLTTNIRGEFDFTFRGFTHCHPLWVFPPLFELPCQLSGQTRHGSFFLLKTPDNEGRIYEIEARQPKPRIRIVDPASAKLRSLKVGDESVIGTTVLTHQFVEPLGQPNYTQTFSKILLEIQRPRQRK